MRHSDKAHFAGKGADRKKGKVWEFLWREVQLDGAIRRKHIVIGTQEDLPTESAAQAAVDAIRLEINQQTPQRLIKSISFETLVNHYRQHELPDIFNKTKPTPDAADEDRKSYSTQVTYEGYLKKWILPRWRVCRLKDIKATDVEKWLKSLCFPRTGVPLARGSRAKIRNIMSALYSHAIRWEWTEKNPITSVRQSAKRQKAPDVLTPEEIMAFLKELPDPLRTMIELDAFTGLRRGELIGLRWQDVDFENLVLHIRRSVVAMVEGAPKTEASLKDVPLDAQTAESLWAWRHLSPYGSPGDWLFASPHERPTALLARHAVAVLRQAGLGTCQGDEASLVSHLPAHVWNAPERERRKSEGRTGVASPRESESHDRRLHAGSRSAEARGTEQFGQIGKAGRRFGNQARLSGSNWIMKKNGDCAEPVYFVGVPDGI